MCVNPEHLTPGTQAENVADMIDRDRRQAPSVPLNDDEKRTVIGLYAMRPQKPYFTQKHIADSLGVSLGTVKRVLREAGATGRKGRKAS
jgi:hypothetical protein